VGIPAKIAVFLAVAFLAGALVGYAASGIVGHVVYPMRVYRVEVTASSVYMDQLMVDIDDQGRVQGMFLHLVNGAGGAKDVYFMVNYLYTNGSIAYTDVYGPVHLDAGQANWTYSITDVPIPVGEFGGAAVTITEQAPGSAAGLSEAAASRSG
jgi:hypothetical protein